MWRFPDRLPRFGQVTDPKGFNDAVRPFRDLPGALGEHHFSDALAAELTRKDDLADNVAYRVAFARREGAVQTAAYEGLANSSAAASAFVLRNQTGWTTVPGTRHTFTTEGGLFFFSFLGAYSTSRNTSDATFFRPAVRVNGTLYVESAIGDLDDSGEALYMEKGLSGYRGGFVCEVLVPLPAGTYAAEGVMAVGKYEGLTTDKPSAAIFNAFLFSWEIGR